MINNNTKFINNQDYIKDIIIALFKNNIKVYYLK